MKKEMFISARDDECRIAIVVDGAMAELYVERASYAAHVGNIYKGRITNVEPSIQAGFVDFGGAKNGFLHISDLHPEYFPGKGDKVEAVGKKRARRERPPIQACLRRGQEVIVQVTKEGIGTKGATMTTYLSIPGRYLVLMPGMARLGVSRKIEDEDARSKARAILQELNPPPDMGFIIRTAGMDQPKSDLQRDLQYLLRLWKSVEQRSGEARAPAELYQESDLVTRTIRDVYTTDIERIVCDDQAVACKVKEFLHLILPRSTNRVELYEEPIGLFQAFGLEAEIDRISGSRVPIPSGGSLVIDQTEAMVAIDVNSGRYRGSDNAEQMAVRINTEAAHEVCRQLRLRDLGGVVVIDFIDMVEEKNRRKIEKIVRDELKTDRARTKALRMSQFGLMELTRQRVRPSLASSVSNTCPRCGGTGHVRTPESLVLGAMRSLRLAAYDERIARIELSASPAVAQYIFNQRRREITDLEQRCAVRIFIKTDLDIDPNQVHLTCADARGMPVEWDAAAASEKRPETLPTREITKDDVAAFHKQMPIEFAEGQGAPPPETAPEAIPEAESEAPDTAAGPGQAQAPQAPGAPFEPPVNGQPGRKRRRRRRKSKGERPAGQAAGAPPPQPPQPAPASGHAPRPAPPHPAQQAPEPQARQAPGAPPRHAKPAEPGPTPQPMPHERPEAQLQAGQTQMPEGEAGPRKKRRRRRRKSAAPGQEPHRQPPAAEPGEQPPTTEPRAAAPEPPASPLSRETRAPVTERPKPEPAAPEPAAPKPPAPEPAAPEAAAPEAAAGGEDKPKPRRRHRRRKPAAESGSDAGGTASEAGPEAKAPE